MRRKKIIVRVRRNALRFTGIAAAARALGVSKQAVSNYVSGRLPSALSPEKRSQITIIEQN